MTEPARCATGAIPTRSISAPARSPRTARCWPPRRPARPTPRLRARSSFYRTGKEEVVFRLPLGAEVLCDLALSLRRDALRRRGSARSIFSLRTARCSAATLSRRRPPAALELFGGRRQRPDRVVLRWNGLLAAAPRPNRRRAGQAALDGAPLSLSSAGSYTAVLTERRLTVFDKQLRVTREAEHSGSRLVLMRDDGVASAVRTSEAQPFNP